MLFGQVWRHFQGYAQYGPRSSRYSDGAYVDRGLKSIANSIESLADAIVWVAIATAAIPVLVKILPLLPLLASRLQKYIAKIARWRA